MVATMAYVYVHVYVCTFVHVYKYNIISKTTTRVPNGTMVRVAMVPFFWYHGMAIPYNGTMVLEYHTMVLEYHGMGHRHLATS
jgi:hypothetical protein